jgi:hypothetical protein
MVLQEKRRQAASQKTSLEVVAVKILHPVDAFAKKRFSSTANS